MPTFFELRKEKLKQAVIDVLRTHPAGLFIDDLLLLVQETKQLPVNARAYHVSNLDDIFSTWSDVISIDIKDNRQVVRLDHKKLHTKGDDVHRTNSKTSVKTSENVKPDIELVENLGSDVETLSESDDEIDVNVSIDQLMAQYTEMNQQAAKQEKTDKINTSPRVASSPSWAQIIQNERPSPMQPSMYMPFHASTGMTQFVGPQAGPVFRPMPPVSIGPTFGQQQLHGAVGGMPSHKMYDPNIYNQAPLGLANQQQHRMRMHMEAINSAISPASVHEMPNCNKDVLPSITSLNSPGMQCAHGHMPMPPLTVTQQWHTKTSDSDKVGEQCKERNTEPCMDLSQPLTKGDDTLTSTSKKSVRMKSENRLDEDVADIETLNESIGGDTLNTITSSVHVNQVTTAIKRSSTEIAVEGEGDALDSILSGNDLKNVMTEGATPCSEQRSLPGWAGIVRNTKPNPMQPLMYMNNMVRFEASSTPGFCRHTGPAFRSANVATLFSDLRQPHVPHAKEDMSAHKGVSSMKSEKQKSETELYKSLGSDIDNLNAPDDEFDENVKNKFVAHYTGMNLLSARKETEEMNAPKQAMSIPSVPPMIRNEKPNQMQPSMYMPFRAQIPSTSFNQFGRQHAGAVFRPMPPVTIGSTLGQPQLPGGVGGMPLHRMYGPNMFNQIPMGLANLQQHGVRMPNEAINVAFSSGLEERSSLSPDYVHKISYSNTGVHRSRDSLKESTGNQATHCHMSPLTVTQPSTEFSDTMKFWEQGKENNVEPIEKSEFEDREVVVRRVYVPMGRTLTKDEVDTVAKECIEILADSNTFVTPELVEKLVCRRYECNSIKTLGLNYIEHLPSVNELNRAVCKVNAYIISFMRSQSICTLHELKECLREYVPDKGDFRTLKLGPLQRFPEIIRRFRFPPNMAEIPPITTSAIMELLDSYLTSANQWTNRVELEPFLNYLVDKYEADSAFMLGIQIKSLPLLIGVLKKAKRDAANQRRGIYEQFKQNLKDDIEEAFSKFKVTILQQGADDASEIRRHYIKLQPETAIMEISQKLNILMMVLNVPGPERVPVPKLMKVLEDFLTLMRADNLGKTLLHLAICMTSTSVQEEALKLLNKPTRDDEQDDQVQSQSSRQPPRKDAVVQSLKKYIKNCLSVRALALPDLNRMEEKLLEEFGFTDFSQMGFGRFLEFLLRETQKVLEDGGGLQLGSGYGGAGDSETLFKPQQDDLYDFIGQCKQCGISQPSEIEAALCKQYNVKEVPNLGYGNIKLLLSQAEKYLRRINMTGMSVCYETPFSLHSGTPAGNHSKVGILGHQTKEAALVCLHNCPLLENLAEWSQWSTVFEPQFGSLKSFIRVVTSVNQIKIEGGYFTEIDIMAMEVSPGELIKLVSSTSQKKFISALRRRDVRSTCGHLVSMAVTYKGIGSMPLALLSSHMKSALLEMYAEESSTSVECSRDPYTNKQEHIAAKFVLQCLLCIPTKLCSSLANQMFLDPLGQIVGLSMSKQLLVQLCVTPSDGNHMEKLGCLLGIHDWIVNLQHKFKPYKSDVQNLPPELEDVVESAEDLQVENTTSDEMYEDDFDDIVSGDFGTDNTTETKENGVEHSDKNSELSLESDERTNEGDTADDQQGDDEAKTADVEDQPEVSTISICEAIINQIRKDEFGVGVHLGEDGERLMKVQQERLGRSLDRLSKDLYSKDTHFVLELIQNADDNSYHDDLLSNQNDDCPAVKFVIGHDGIYVLNNELGFKEKDIKALCDVGRSTKGKHKFGYIGQKGIGFKSVFRVTDCPEVHSNGFHIKFDVNSGPMGYILPHWVQTDEQSDNEWTTHIILRLKAAMLQQTRTLAARFNDIHPSLLLFLHRLRKITIVNKVDHREKTMHRRDVGNNVIEIQHTESNTSERWLVLKSTLDASKISLQAKSGADVESTEIALAFPIKSSGQKSTNKILPPKQPVFAFLPLRSYGFRFIIQGDFDVPSSREDVDRDSSWNQWLRNEIPTVFVEALETFKSHNDYSTMDAVCAFLQFVPMEDEVLDFFKPVAADILRKLKGKQCIPTLHSNQGTISWKLPSQTVRVEDHRIRSIITPELLQAHLNLFYLHSDVAANLNPTLTSCLGIEALNSEHLSKLGCALIMDMGTHCKYDKDVIQVARWLACMYCSLDEFHNEDTILTTLQSHKLFPLSDGEFVSLKDKAVFYPIPDSSKIKGADKDIFYYLQHDVITLHPLLLNTGDDEVNSQVYKLLVRLGIKKMSPGEVINHHIIPVLKSDTWQSKSKETLISYMCYIKIQTNKQPSVCNMEDIRDVAVILTNHGFKHPSRDCVHFPPEYGNRINLKREFPGYDWTLLNSCYLPRNSTSTDVHSWMSFFKKLGVEEFLSIRKTEVHIRRVDLASSIWRTMSDLLPTEDEYIVQDYKCVELEQLIIENKFPDEYVEQMRSLCTYLDRMWDKHYYKFCTTRVQTKDGKDLKETETSFSIVLRTSQWLPTTEMNTSLGPDGSIVQRPRPVMKEPACLYLRSPAVYDLLADNVLYVEVQLSAESFKRFLGLKINVAIETVKEQLMTWSARSNTEEPTQFCTTMGHIKNVYRYLSDNLRRQELRDLLQKNPVVFVPNKNVGNIGDWRAVIPGTFLSRHEVWMCDNTGLMDKYSSLLTEFHSDLSTKRTIQSFYLDIVQIFTDDGKIDKQPSIEEYIELLSLLCSTSPPKKLEILHDVYHIFSTIGRIVLMPCHELDSNEKEVYLKPIKSKIMKKLQTQKVFPTKGQIWASLADHPLIADNKEYEKMFENKEGVHFLDMEQGSKKGLRKSRRYVQSNDGHIQQDMINQILEMCGIIKLSEVVDIVTAPDVIQLCTELQSYVYNIVPTLQQYLMSKYEDIYGRLEQMNTRQMLSDAKFYQVNKLEVSYILKDMPKVIAAVREEKCSIDPPTFYINRQHLDSAPEINKEIARYFSLGDKGCNNLLRSFLTELSGIISGSTDETVEGLLLRDNVEIQDIADESVWKVEPPNIPEPIKVEPESEEPGTEEIEIVTQEGPFELKMWPPVANNNKHTIRADGTERPVSNIWPPPEGTHFKKSVDLPANIRLSSAVHTPDDSKANKDTTDNQDQDKQSLEVPVNKSVSAQPPSSMVTLSSDEHIPEIKDQQNTTVINLADTTTTANPSDKDKQEGGEPGVQQKSTNEDRGPGSQRKLIDGRGDSGSNDIPTNRKNDQQGQQNTDGLPHLGHHQQGHEGHHRRGPRQGWVASDDPVWSHLATEYSYDDLGSSSDLCKFVTSSIEETASLEEIGRWGEALVAEYLNHQKESGMIHDYIWKNEKCETASPYDFEIQYADGQRKTEYIEVKSTCSDTKEVFPISIHQVRFAQKQKDHFHIYRLFNAGRSDNVRLIRISDLNGRLSNKQVKLCMLI